MFVFKKSKEADMHVFQKWSKEPAVHRWVPIEDWIGYYRAVASQQNYFLISIYREMELIAFAAAEITDNKAAILLIVSPEHQGRGIGTAILMQIKAQYRPLFGDITALCAGIFPGNTASIRCFEKAGFQESTIGKDGEIQYTYIFGG